ncbi:MAG: hypothetical protein IIU77_03015 [Clostridia bacterium]|nr:hypothetical protein [Clostridia bacterium]
MANPTMKNQVSERELYEQKYRSSRMNLLLVVIFTAVNLVLLVTNADTYFLFSAFIPYFITLTGMAVCGLFPNEYYEGLEEIVFLDKSVFVVLLIISVVLTLLYLLAWLMSNKNRVGWLIFALVFFGIDTLGMFFINGISIESAFDILFHAWVIYYLVVGISAHYKLKKLPVEEETVSLSEENTVGEIESDEEISEDSDEEIEDSPILRRADTETKFRVLLEARVDNYRICYRRIKHTNELVINGNVYAELKGIIESAHILGAVVDGHIIEASFNGTHSIIEFDEKLVAKKLRLF